MDKAVNKVVYAGQTLIDLTNDSVTEYALLQGYTAHKADGTKISGKVFGNYPSEQIFTNDLADNKSSTLLDSTGNPVIGRTIYKKL